VRESVVVIHGGCGTVPEEFHETAVLGVGAAARAAQKVLRDGGGCEAAAVAAVRVLEEDPAFNAGRGSCMTAAGTFEHDAGIMRSRDLRSGAVGGVPDVRDAILLARLVMERTEHCLVVGPGAVALGREFGVGTFGRDAVWCEKAQARYDAVRAGVLTAEGRADTVGAVVLDSDGELCAAVSTGGVLLKRPGRVGDSPLVGSGFYAHPRLRAAVTTGKGEAILTHLMAYESLQRVARGADPQGSTEAFCRDVAAAEKATCGVILITPDGRTAVAHASQHMSWALARGQAEPLSGLAQPR